jgi:hypothetical protein
MNGLLAAISIGLVTLLIAYGLGVSLRKRLDYSQLARERHAARA